jgi:MFS family permease
MSESPRASVRKGNTLLGLQALSDFGDQITAALLALSIIDVTQSTTKAGLVYFLSTVGFVVFTLLGGYLGDRISKRHILFYSDLGRGLVVLAMIAAFFMKSLALIYVTSFFLSMLGSLHRPVKLSLWASSIPRNRHGLYNSLSELSTHTSIILGPLIAAFLISLGYANWGFAVDAMTFFVCAFIFFTIVSDQPIATLPLRSHSDILIGFRLIFQNKELFKYIAFDAIQMVTHGAFNATLLILLQRDFGFSKAQYSYHLSIAAGFAVVGAVLGLWKRFSNLSALSKLFIGNIITGLSYALVLYYKTFPLASIFFGICNGTAVVIMVVTKTKVQMQANHQFPSFLTSILAARSILIKTATLLGCGTCLIVDRFLNLEFTLWILLAPLALAFFPVVDDMLEAVRDRYRNIAQNQTQ